MPGHEACRLYSRESHWHLDGSTEFSFEKRPCHLSYSIACDAGWQTQTATVMGWVGKREIDLQIRTDSEKRWWLNDVEIPSVSGCIDLDLNFSPSTNTIAIRRLKLASGEKKEFTAAWLRFPSFTLEPLPQSYQRLENNLYRYESWDGQFVADLTTDRVGWVTNYPGIWTQEASI